MESNARGKPQQRLSTMINRPTVHRNQGREDWVQCGRRSLILVGPGKHFGYHLACRFGVEGFHIGVVGRTESKLALLCARLRERSIMSDYGVADVSRASQIQRALCLLSKKLPEVACVIYNVKESVPTRELERDPERLTHALAVNVTGAYNTILGSVQHLERRDAEMNIIVTGGGYKDRPNPERLALSVAKAAIHALTLGLGASLQKQYGAILKTVVIDGVVRESGPLRSCDVADYFWSVYRAKGRKARCFRFPLERGRMEVRGEREKGPEVVD